MLLKLLTACYIFAYFTVGSVACNKSDVVARTTPHFSAKVNGQNKIATFVGAEKVFGTGNEFITVVGTVPGDTVSSLTVEKILLVLIVSIIFPIGVLRYKDLTDEVILERFEDYLQVNLKGLP